MKRVGLIFLLFILTISFSGCRKIDTTEIRDWTYDNVSYQKAEIIYEIYSEPRKIIDGYRYWKKDDIVLNIKYGWNEEKIEYTFTHYENDNYKLICFASYIYVEIGHQNIGNSVCDDYKNFENSIFIEEIEKEVFLSDYYKANIGKKSFFYTKKPTFSNENEGIKLKLTSDYIEWIEESTFNYNKEFHFSVVPVYYNLTTNKYNLDFGGKYDGIKITYNYDEDKKLASISVGC